MSEDRRDTRWASHRYKGKIVALKGVGRRRGGGGVVVVMLGSWTPHLRRHVNTLLSIRIKLLWYRALILKVCTSKIGMIP